MVSIKEKFTYQNLKTMDYKTEAMMALMEDLADAKKALLVDLEALEKAVNWIRRDIIKIREFEKEIEERNREVIENEIPF